MQNDIIIFCAKYIVFIIPLIAAVWWFFQKDNRLRIAGTGVLACIIGFLTSRIASHLYYDPRPFVTHNVTPLLQHAADNGFPSDHTLLSAVVAFAIFMYNRTLGSILLVLAIIVGVGRIAAHVHSPIDILGSIVIGAVAALIAKPATNYIVGKFNHGNREETIPS